VQAERAAQDDGSQRCLRESLHRTIIDHPQ
jgi:hypothetical protein